MLAGRVEQRLEALLDDVLGGDVGGDDLFDREIPAAIMR